MDGNPILTERLTDIYEARDECRGECWLRWRGDVEHDIVGWPPFAEKPCWSRRPRRSNGNLFQSSLGGKTQRRITWPKKLPVLSGNELVRV